MRISDWSSDVCSSDLEGSRIRVGPSAAGYAFPAPSGVVDYNLRTPGTEAMVSGVFQTNSWGGAAAEFDSAFPVTDVLSVGAGARFSRSESPSGNNADISNLPAILHWPPAPENAVHTFVSPPP